MCTYLRVLTDITQITCSTSTMDYDETSKINSNYGNMSVLLHLLCNTYCTKHPVTSLYYMRIKTF